MSQQDIERLKSKIKLTYGDHSRLSEYNRIVYPVISRRSKGLSLGINLNLDKRCSFNCAYCQVDRTVALPEKTVFDFERMVLELREWLGYIRDSDGEFEGFPLIDIAIAGDGEPTLVKHLPEVVMKIISLKREFDIEQSRIVIVTNGSNIARQDMDSIWPEFFNHQGDIWFKLDFWDELSYQKINRTNVPIARIKKNFELLSHQYQIIIQSCFFKEEGQEFTPEFYFGYIEQIQEFLRRGAKIKYIQAYTLARTPAEALFPWSNSEMDCLVKVLKGELSVPVEVYYEKG